MISVPFVARIQQPNNTVTDEQAKQLCDRIREQAYDLHQWLRNGQLEKVYENGLYNRIQKAGLDVKQQFPIQVFDRDDTLLGDFYADLLVQDDLVIELKACKALADEHVAQILGYLRASKKRHGLLINFGAPALQIKKYVL